MVKLKRTIFYSIVFTDFQHPKLHPFKNLSLGFILKISLKFCKFQLRYSYKTQYKETACNKQYNASTMGSNNVCFLCEQFSAPIDTATQSGVEVQPRVVCKVSWKARNLKVSSGYKIQCCTIIILTIILMYDEIQNLQLFIVILRPLIAGFRFGHRGKATNNCKFRNSLIKVKILNDNL